MQIKASEFTELNMKELKKNEMILVIFVDWHYREKPRPYKSLDIFFTWIGLPSSIPSTHEAGESSHRNIRLI